MSEQSSTREARSVYASAGLEALIAYLRGAGATVMESVLAVAEISGCSLNQAKQNVHDSHVWADAKADLEKLQADLEDAARDL